MTTRLHRSIIAQAICLTVFMMLMPLMANGQTSQPPTARFDWSMQNYFGKMKGDVMDFHWDADRQTYDRDYVNPSSWHLDFNACTSSAGSAPIQEFVWTFQGLGGAPVVIRKSSCELIDPLEFPRDAAQGRHFPVTLTVRATDGQQSAMTQDVFVRNWLIVSIGDSIASGEGNPDVPQAHDSYNVVTAGPRWIDQRCHRSRWSGPAQAALKLEQADSHTSVTFLSFACSGATIEHGLVSEFDGAEPVPTSTGIVPAVAPQLLQVKNTLESLDLGRKIDALLISIGANDIGFRDLATYAVKDNPYPLPREYSDEAYNDPRVLALFPGKLPTLVMDLDMLASKIENLSLKNPSPSKVYITEYPDPMTGKDGQYCSYGPFGDILAGISSSEAKWASESVVGSLNSTLNAAADRHSWKYIGNVAAAFHGHGYCAPLGTRWVNTGWDANWIQGGGNAVGLGSSGTLHPNGFGHYFVYADRLFQEMQLSTKLATSVNLNRGARAGTVVSVTVHAKDINSQQSVPTARWRIDNDPLDRPVDIAYDLRLDGAYHTITVFDDHYANSGVAFDLPLQDMTLSLDHFVRLDTLTSVTVFAKDAAGNPVNGRVTISSPGAKSTDPAFTGPYTNSAPVSNYPINGIFRAKVARYTDPNGDIVVTVIPPTATVTAPNFKPTTIVLIDQ